MIAVFVITVVFGAVALVLLASSWARDDAALGLVAAAVALVSVLVGVLGLVAL